METLYFYYEFTYDFGKPPKGQIFDQTQFTNKYYPKNPYFIPPFRNQFTIYQIKSNCCPYICNSDKAKNDSEFLEKVDEFEHEKVKELLIFHYGKYQGNKNDFLSYCQYLLDQDTWIIQDNFKKTILLEKCKELQNIACYSDTSKTGFQSSLTGEPIQRLFVLLKGSYIDINTNPDHFKAIFSPNPLPPDYLPIKRTKQFTGTLLAYFISELFQKENPSDYWHIAESCFDMTKNLRQSLYNTYSYNTKQDSKPRGYKDIDTILKNIYSPLQ